MEKNNIGLGKYITYVVTLFQPDMSETYTFKQFYKEINIIHVQLPLHKYAKSTLNAPSSSG